MTQPIDDADVLAGITNHRYGPLQQGERVLVVKAFKTFDQVSEDELQEVLVPVGNEGTVAMNNQECFCLTVDFGPDVGVQEVLHEAVMSLERQQTTPLFRDVKPIVKGKRFKDICSGSPMLIT